jgi:hypothetical protein
MDAVGEVADAVLYEGYLLYPYRASAQKNQLRWQFGVLAPRDWAERNGEGWYSRTECLLEPGSDPELGTVLRVRLRFLRLRHRQVQCAGPTGYQDVDQLTVAGQLHLSWDEGIAEIVDAVLPIPGERHTVEVRLAGETSDEWLTDEQDRTVGRLRRRTWPVQALISITTSPLPGPYGALRLSVQVENTASRPDVARDVALRHSLLGAHSILALSGGQFLSQADPPEWARAAAAECVNEHTWPALAGDDPARPRLMLSSPIILSDFPEIAPESPNELYDGTENDEILTLRTMTLTDAEKREARATDPRAAALLDAVDGMPPEILERLHGVIRSFAPSERGACPGADPLTDADGIPTYHGETGGKPWWDPGEDASVDPETDSVLIGGHPVARGSEVVLRPSGRADAQDLFLVGRQARVQAVLHDVDGEVHLAVSLLDDGCEEFLAGHGRFRYFRPDEVEVSR